ncbi:TMhelix containing protein [Vibrio phage 1.137.O._10N.261.46.B5]|nr:TMhelix containing protein [Vibrio phage 1.137.O._10N.261.46.B5]
MRKYKVRKKDFERIFTRRELTFRERYMQSIWFLETSKFSYIMVQRLNFFGTVATLIFAVLATLPLFITGGVKGLWEFWGATFGYLMGEPIRKDYCYLGNESTEKLIKLAGWKL